MSPREAGSRRRKGLLAYGAAVLAWTVAFMTALVLLPPGAHTVAAAHADSSSVTVPGPPVLDPATGTTGARGTVTASQTQNLLDQMVHVSWTGFTPSTGGNFITHGGTQLGWSSVQYPVVVYQCRGTAPKITDCYGSNHYGQKATAANVDGFEQDADAPGLSAPDFPNNEQAAITHADGTGSLDIEVYTANQAPSLKCDANNPCSLVVEPNYGGDVLGYNTPDFSPNCADHSADSSEATNVTFDSLDGLNFAGGEQCAWKNHTVIPISFAPVPGACAASATGIAAEGMPMLDRALQQWVVGACLAGNNPVTVSYASGLTESTARADFLRGGPRAEVAFTSLPADPAATSARPYTYVPIGSTGIVVAFLVDDPVTNLPITSMKLNARLLAKLLTQSYDLEHIPGQKSDTDSVAGNPMCLYNDPEFQALNPAAGFTWPACPALSGPDTLPIVMGGKTDLTRELTTWILSDPDARAFLAGTDNGSTHVDTKYQSSVFPYPIDSFVPQDATGPAKDPNTGEDYDKAGTHRDYPHLKGFEWNPVQTGLDDVLRHLLAATPTCVLPDFNTQVPGGHAKCGAENPGSRGVLAVMDSGRAAAFNLPTASLLNAAGTFTAPTAPAMASAAADYVTDPATGTQSLNWGAAHTAYSGDTKAYPLTVPNYAMAPVSGVSPAKAATIADFLSAVTDNRSGQFAGTAPGELAPGYVANTPAQAVQAGAAIAKIRQQPAPGGGSTSTVTAAGPTATAPGGAPPPPAAGATTVVTAVTNGKTTVYTSTVGGGAGDGTTAAGGSAATGSSSKAAAGATGSGPPTRPLGGSTAPAAAVGKAVPDQAGPARYLLPVLLVAGLVLVAAGPLGLLLSAPGGVGARIRGLRVRPRPARRFGK